MLSFNANEVNLELLITNESDLNSIIIRGEKGFENKALVINEVENILRLLSIKSIKNIESTSKILNMFKGKSYKEVERYLTENNVSFIIGKFL